MSNLNTPRVSDTESPANVVPYKPTSLHPPHKKRTRLGDAESVFRELTDIRAADREHFVAFDLNVDPLVKTPCARRRGIDKSCGEA